MRYMSFSTKAHNNSKAGLIPSIAVFIAGVLASGIISVKLGQCVDFDLLNYHFYNAYSFLNGRLDFDYGVANIHGYFNPLPDLPLYFLITHLKPIWAGFLMGTIHGIPFWIIFALSYVVLEGLTPILRLALSVACAVTSFLGPFNLSELGASMNDNTIGIFVLLSLLILSRALIADRQPGSISYYKSVIAAGAFMGMGAGLKLTNMTYAVGATLAFVFLSMRWKERLKSIGFWVIGLIAGFLTSSGFWMYILWRKFESPLYPFYNKIFKSPYFYDTNFHDNRYFPKELSKWLFLPFYLINDKTALAGRVFGDIRLAVVFTMAAVAIGIYVFKKLSQGGWSRTDLTVTDNSHRFLLAFFLCSYVVWEQMFFIYRYALPLEMLSPVIIVILVMYLSRDEKKRAIAITVIFSASILFTRIPDWGRRPWPETFFNISVPTLKDPDNTIIIMPFSLRARPSYLVPFFPKGVRFMRFQSLITNPKDDSKMQSEMRDILERHNGPVYLMSRNPDMDDFNLEYYYKFSMVDLPVLRVRGDHENYGLYPVARF